MRPGRQDLVVGGGIIGLLVAPSGGEIARHGSDARRRADSGAPRRGAGRRFALPARPPKEADCVFHTSASAAGLDLALSCAGFEADRRNELVWRPGGGGLPRQRVSQQAAEADFLASRASRPSRRTLWAHGRRLGPRWLSSTIRASMPWSSRRSISPICRGAC